MRLIASVALLLGTCVSAMGGVATIAVANAEPAGSSTQDDTFFWLLAEPDDDGFAITVTNPALMRVQGLRVCQNIDNGMASLDAANQLMVEGPYPKDVARRIASSAIVAYCNPHTDF